MPLIVFVGISSLGAVFMIVFIAQLFRDEHQADAASPGMEGRGGRAVRRADSCIPVVSKVAPRRDGFSSVLVLRKTIECGEPNRLTRFPGKRTHAEKRETWQ